MFFCNLKNCCTAIMYHFEGSALNIERPGPLWGTVCEVVQGQEFKHLVIKDGAVLE